MVLSPSRVVAVRPRPAGVVEPGGREVVHGRLHAAAGELATPASLRPISTPDQCGHQRQVVAVAEVADAEHAALQLAQAGAQREVEALVDQASQRIGVDAYRRDHAGQHRRVHAPGRRTGSAGPRRAPRRARPRPSAGGARRPAAGPRRAACPATRSGRTAGWCWACRASSRPCSSRRSRPRPRRHAAASPSSLASSAFGRQRVEADARRQHQALLRAADGDVDAPLVVAVVGAGRPEMVSTISSAGWPAASIARRTAAMSEVTPVEVSLCTTHTALMRVAGVAAQALLRSGRPARRGASASGSPVVSSVPWHGQELRLQAQAQRHLLPQRGEVAGLEHQHLVAGAHACWPARPPRRRCPRPGRSPPDAASGRSAACPPAPSGRACRTRARGGRWWAGSSPAGCGPAPGWGPGSAGNGGRWDAGRAGAWRRSFRDSAEVLHTKFICQCWLP